jgi:hypothetical protein
VNIPRRIKQQSGLHSLVDGIPFVLPVNSVGTPALFAAFPIEFERAKELLAGNEVHPFRLGRKGLLVITVVDYLMTDIGKYIEFSIAIACTHGPKPAPPFLPALFRNHYGLGQFVVDLPVSTEISVKGGTGIWGMPKHQANLDFVITGDVVSSQYDKDGQLGVRIEIDRPRRLRLPISVAAANYCGFRGMLMKSYIYFSGRMAVGFGRSARARLFIGDHPRVQALKTLNIGSKPMFTGFLENAKGVLDDHYEGWFLGYQQAPAERPEGLESVIDLGLSQEWLDPPKAPYDETDRVS